MSEEKFEKVQRSIEKIETLLTSTMTRVNERDEIIKKKDNIITDLTNKLIESQKQKDEITKSKFEALEQITKEREELHSEFMKNQKLIYEQEKIIQDLSSSGDTAHLNEKGSSEKLKELQALLNEKEKKIHDMQSRVASIATGATGIFYDQQGIVDYIKKGITTANRSLRIVVPNIDFLKDNGLQTLIESVSENCVVNIATSLNLSKHFDTVEKWRKRKFYITEFTDENLICISSNGADVAVALIQGNSLSGIYTNIPELVSIFNQAVMHAFIKGKKI
jgi:hypothetical protein